MFPELHTARFHLTRIVPEDQQFIFEGLSHPSVINFYGVRYDTFEATATQMDWYEKMWNEGWGIPWKIIEKTTGEKIGVIAFYFYKPEHRKAEVGFWLMPKWWQQGVASECLKPVVQYCQQKKGVHRLEAFVEIGNEGSSRVLQKAGFTCEGTLRDYEMKNGKYISLLVYSLILSTEDFTF